MTGKRAAASTTENKPFAIRLRELMTERGENQKELAEKLGVKQQTISYYRNGQSTPDAENLIKIAQYYGVTTDFLLGLTEVRTTDIDLKAVCEYTGLCEGAVSALHDAMCNETKPILQLFIDILTNGSSWFLTELHITKLLALCKIVDSIDISSQTLPELFELEQEVYIKSHGLFQMQPIHEQIEHTYSEIMSHLGSIIDEITDCNRAQKAATEKWVGLLRMARHPNAYNPGGELNAET